MRTHLSTLLAYSFFAYACRSSALPRNDSFYDEVDTSELAGLTPGTIIDFRTQSNLLLAFTPVVIQSAWTVKYVTTNAQDEKVAAVTTLIAPFGAADKILSFQTAYDSANLDCSPSYQLGAGNTPLNLTEALYLEKAVIALALAKSWYVVILDYEGLTASVTSGLTSGRAVLDSITAAINSGSFTSIPMTSQVVLAGYSGGALATEWAAELENDYAPKLAATIVGIAAGGLPVNVNNTLAFVNGPTAVDNGSSTYLIPNALQGIASAYADFATYLRTSLAPSKETAFKYSLNSCNDAEFYRNQDIFQTYFKPGISQSSFTSSDSYKYVLNRGGIMGRHGRPIHPTYFFQGAQDEIVSPNATTELVQTFCGHDLSRKDISLEYILNPDTTHAGEALVGIGGALQFLQDRFDGKPAFTGCTMRTIEPFSTLLPILN
ncbi:hypothetical protein FH972_025248 [Carpinus fangiana]|uniref:Uncharacterized protein n=1 Tax=Carpinus fangiana TaxID=176857 RepID=A0A5N6L132_9ROSI|nr:hypothetical protein FH972_025248 [Carpinus fangiana]